MARRKSREKRPRVKRSDRHIRDVLAGDLQALAALASSYDQGATKVVTVVATVINNIVTASSREAVEARGRLVFPSPPGEANQEHLTPYHRLITAEMGGDPPAIRFRPWFIASSEPAGHQPFRIWWNTEPIYVASIAAPGIPLGAIPIRPEDQIPWEEREKLTRQQLVTDVRNTLGAHGDDEIPALLDDLYQAQSFMGGAGVQMPDGRILSTDDGSLPVEIAPVEAALRQIAEEVLIAYGHRSSQT